MAKKKVQTEETDVKVVEAVVENSETKKKSKSKEVKKDTKVENTKVKDPKSKTKNKKDKKSLKKKASEIWSELKKVSRPSFGKVCKNTCVVIAVVAICTLLLFGIDRLFGWLNVLLLP